MPGEQNVLPEKDLATLLATALERLFLPRESLGFWDDEKGRIIARLDHDKHGRWSISPVDNDRYGPFTLSAILLAQRYYGLDLSCYEEKIKRYLAYIKGVIKTLTRSEITYGAFNALVLGNIFYPNMKLTAEIEYCVQLLSPHLPQSRNNEDFLALIGLTLLAENDSGAESARAKEILRRCVDVLLYAEEGTSFFSTGDMRYLYHQRTMYILWGLAFAAGVTPRAQETWAAVERTLARVWQSGRDRLDDAFLWHPKLYLARRWSFVFPIILPSAEYLYECHQTFFANAISLARLRGGISGMQTERKEALAWIFGKNRLHKDLVAMSSLGVPVRMMKRNGAMFVRGENFKGSYEVGSYILALAALHRDR